MTPVNYSSCVKLTQSVCANGIHLRKGDQIMIGMGPLCYDKEQWIAPDQFIPERFDPSSQYWLTPSGDKRNPFAFSPFLGGHRICLGKTFVEEMSKLTIPVIMQQYDFAILDTDKLPEYNNMLCRVETEVLVTLKRLN